VNEISQRLLTLSDIVRIKGVDHRRLRKMSRNIHPVARVGSNNIGLYQLSQFNHLPDARQRMIRQFIDV
jgi:hypothetical protein